jgi:lipid A 3-O-deacylase
MSFRKGFAAGFVSLLCSQVSYADPIVSEVRIGGLYHDAGVISSRKETGADVNSEVLFSSPDILKVIWSPRPDLGGTVNLWGQTSQVYAGLTWGYNFSEHFFGEFSFGPSFNNGHLNKDNENRKDLGSPILFRESLSFGVKFNKHNTLSMFMDHISNGGLAKYNGGMETVGLRYGYKF